jgi:baculoviral IAP repeat-containing protein 7/8
MDTEHQSCASTTNIIDFNLESMRLESFRQCQNDFLVRNKEILALQGFYFQAPPDKVKCMFCNLVLGNWKPNDDPLTDHLKYSGNCILLKRRATSNVPISPATLNDILPPASFDEYGFSHTNANNFEHPEYQLPNKRLRTFEMWPLSLKQKPVELVEAGFFYTGMADRVICFCCGVGLGKWEETDSPWLEHVKHGQACEFLQLNLGTEKIKTMLQEIDKQTVNQITTEKFEQPTDVDGEKVCKVCYEKETDVALIPCGHVFCRHCAFLVNDCPICRRTIQKKVKLFFS